MSYDGIELAIKATTLSTVGVDVSPHLFAVSRVYPSFGNDVQTQPTTKPVPINRLRSS